MHYLSSRLWILHHLSVFFDNDIKKNTHLIARHILPLQCSRKEYKSASLVQSPYIDLSSDEVSIWGLIPCIQSNPIYERISMQRILHEKRRGTPCQIISKSFQISKVIQFGCCDRIPQIGHKMRHFVYDITVCWKIIRNC